MQEASGLSQEMFNLVYEQVIVTEHAPRDRFYLLERRHGLAEIVGRGVEIFVERHCVRTFSFATFSRTPSHMRKM